MSEWTNRRINPPTEGVPVVILKKNGQDDPESWTTDIAYYCDGSFWNLEYDPHLGILRKSYVMEPVEYWAEYMNPPV